VSRQGLGRHGETLAGRYLEGRGLVVIDRNVRTNHGELDIVARDGDELVFVEVKTRQGDDETAPDVAVTAAKLERLERLAEAYLAEHNQTETAWRIDVIGIVVNRSGQVVRLDDLTGAFA
jgi:putative endonuclease